MGPRSTEDPKRGPDPEATGEERSPGGLYLYGVARTKAWRSVGTETEALVKVRYRDVEALVRPVPYQIPRLDDDGVREHQRFVEGVMRRGTILPAPFGLVFRGRRAIIRFLEDQYIVLDEGLAFLDGHWELRLHVSGDAENDALRELAIHLYSELRRFARAAIPLASGEGRLMSAAFLVERTTWIDFVERSDDLGLTHPELGFDVTGPWPPYDFVRIQS